MASVSVSHLILFIASMVVAASVAGTFTSSVDRLSDAIGDQGLEVSDEVRTDVEVITDAGSQVYNRSGNDNVTIHVKNTGSQELPADADTIDVFLDGQYRTDLSLTELEDDDGTWQVGDVVELQFNEPSLSTGDHRVKVVVNGDEEVFRFRL